MTTTTTTASSMFSAYASFAGSMMLVRSMANQLIPDPIRSYLYSKLNYLFTPLSSNLTMIIDELSGAARNQVYDAAEIYLKTIAISPSTERLRVRKTSRQKSITVAMHKDEQLSDTFHNVKLTWRFKSIEATNGGSGGGRSNKKSAEKRHFELSFHKKHKDIVINSYLPHVLARADAIKEEQKVVKLYSRSLCSYDDDMTMISSWGSANMEHPSTFETMALDPEMKKMIMEDLERFVRRREFYKKAGKAWKRGYLLYGPPGTGKSSLIAAMANYLKYDVYDLELASIYSNHELRRVLLSTTNRSILVIEDIDCTVDLKNRKLKDKDYSQPGPNKLTLSGLLNFIDGLWSSCGDERIIVFTTNHKDRLDPALLRAGRMDVHIHLSYCTTSGFRILASNYLGIDGGGNNPHPLCSEIEGLIESAEVTPAEVAEELMKSDDADGALQGLVNFLKRKKVESNKTEDESEGSTEKAKRQKTDEGEETE